MKRSNAIYNATLGIAGLVVGSLCAVASTALLFQARQPVDVDALKTTYINECQMIGQREQGLVTVIGDVVEFRLSGVNDYREKLLKSTLVAEQCKGFAIKSFCMGDCTDANQSKYQGIIMMLQYTPPTLK